MAHLIPIATMLLATEETSESTGGFSLSFLIVLLAVGVGLYFVMSAPQRRRQKKMAKMRSAIEIGDEIRTVGGIYGIVTATDEGVLTIDVGGGTTLRIDERAVGERLEPVDDDEQNRGNETTEGESP